MSVKKGQPATLDIQLAGATAPVTATIGGVALATAPAIVSGTLDTYRFALSASETNASIVTIVARDALSLEWGIVVSTDETDHAAIAATNAKAANLPADPASNTAVNTRQASSSFATDSRAALGLAAANLDTQLTGIGAKVDGANVRGSGDKQVQLVIKNTGGVAVPDTEVTVTTDAAGSLYEAGPVHTDAFGKTPILMLASGTYYRWASKSGETFTNPQLFTVT